MSLLLFLHLWGIAMWLGGTASAMTLAIASRAEDRVALRTVARLKWMIIRNLVLGGALLTLITGLGLTMQLGGAAMSSGWLVAMQVLGVVGALLVLTIQVPGAAKLARLDPVGEHAAYFDRLQSRQRWTEQLTGIVVLLALLAGSFHRYVG